MFFSIKSAIASSLTHALLFDIHIKTGASNENDNDEEHLHDQLPTVDEVLVDRGQGRVLLGSIGAEVHDDPQEPTPQNKNGGCWGTLVKVLLIGMMVASGFAVGILAGDKRMTSISRFSAIWADDNDYDYDPIRKHKTRTIGDLKPRCPKRVPLITPSLLILQSVKSP